MRISLIVAIIAGLAVGGINLVKVKDTIVQTRKKRDEWHAKFTDTDNKLTSTTKELEETKTTLATTKQDLETAVAAKDKAETEATAANRRATQLTEELTRTRTERDDALAGLERYKGTLLTPEQILALSRTLRQTQDALDNVQQENGLLARKIDRLDYELKKYRGERPQVPLPATLTGKVLVSDPKWDFVVLNVGEDQGMKIDGELLVNRNGKLVAKVIVRDVQKNRSIANVLPGWKLGEPMEGDLVIPANPES